MHKSEMEIRIYVEVLSFFQYLILASFSQFFNRTFSVYRTTQQNTIVVF